MIGQTPSRPPGRNAELNSAVSQISNLPSVLCIPTAAGRVQLCATGPTAPNDVMRKDTTSTGRRDRCRPGALLTDLYQLTMAHGYWKEGRADWEAAFHVSFRQNPFRGGYTLASGLADCACYLRDFRFEA